MLGLILRAIFHDHVVQEKIVQASSLDWVIARLAVFIDGPATGACLHGFAPSENKLTLKISRANVAGFMPRQLDNNSYLHQTPGLSY